MLSTKRPLKTAPAMAAILNGFHDYATEHNGYFPLAYDPETGEDRWLDTTIFPQIYPNAAPEEVDLQQGHYLQMTVFQIRSNVITYPKEQNRYNHSVALNRDLITDKIARQSEHPEFTPRNRNLFADDAATMIIIEVAEGDHNSISHTDRAQLMPAPKRNGGKYIHAGFMDGHVERVKKSKIPITTNDEGAWFWTGAPAQK